MTVAATLEKEDKKAAKAAIAARQNEMDEREAKLNEGRTGKGLRWFIGMTRGRNPIEVKYEGFDESKPETLPESVQEFINLTKVNDDKELTSLLVAGLNDRNYTAASDPLSEFVNSAWPEDVQTQFRTIVRNYAKAMEIGLEEASALYKPAFDKKYGV